MIGYGLVCNEEPLSIGNDWVVFANQVAAKMAAQMLEALTCEEFVVINLENYNA
jgi:hypothetical protein